MKRSTLKREENKSNSRRVILTKMFSNFYSLKGMTLERAVSIIKPFKGVISKELEYLTKDNIRRGWGSDIRRGEETYE